MPAVEVAELRHRYGAVPSLNGVSFTAAAGAITAVLGPNGAGKTTTLEICEGFRRPESGTVRVLGTDPWRADAEHRARVGVLLQDGGIPPAVTVGGMLTHAARLYARPAPPEQVAESLGLTPLWRRNYRALSGGEKRRLALACALIPAPDVVILDEPTTGLDPGSRRDVWTVVTAAARAGAAVVLSTHYMDEAEALADSVVIVDRGLVVATGSPADLVGGAASGPVRFSAPQPVDVAALQVALGPTVQVSDIGGGEYALTGPVEPQTVALVTSWCAERGFLPDGLTGRRRSLEDLFLELTDRGSP